MAQAGEIQRAITDITGQCTGVLQLTAVDQGLQQRFCGTPRWVFQFQHVAKRLLCGREVSPV